MAIFDPSNLAFVEPQTDLFLTTTAPASTLPAYEEQSIGFGSVKGKIKPSQLPVAALTTIGAVKQTAIDGNSARGTVLAAQAPAGVNEIDRAALNTDLTTMRDNMHTELSLLHTELNDLKQKLRDAGIMKT